MTRGVFTGILTVLGVIAVTTGARWSNLPMTSENNTVVFNIEAVARLRAEILPLDLRKPPVHTPLMNTYYRYYGIQLLAESHFFGTIRCGSYRIATHVFYPPGAQATVFILHGYFDHSGVMTHLIRNCLQQQLAVVCFDLPGHGLSSGAAASIDDFSEYTNVLADVIRFCRPSIPGPLSAVGHSAGCAVLFEYLYQHQNEDHSLSRVILVAPLVRHTYWHVSKIHHFLTKPFVNAYPRPFRTNSSDPQFLDALRSDPLEGDRIPLNWLGALYAWNHKIADYKQVKSAVLIIQGTADSVVDWKFNLSFLETKLPMLTVKTIGGGRHHLLNESQDMRNEVMAVINHFLCAQPKYPCAPIPSKASQPQPSD